MLTYAHPPDVECAYVWRIGLSLSLVTSLLISSWRRRRLFVTMVG